MVTGGGVTGGQSLHDPKHTIGKVWAVVPTVKLLLLKLPVTQADPFGKVS